MFSALSKKTNRQILRTLTGGPATVRDVMNRLSDLGVETKYRESVYKALEKLVLADLVKKTYVQDKGICYELKTSKIIIDFKNLKAEG
jgi:Fe2+ or Zn2+ uptake regulation protein